MDTTEMQNLTKALSEDEANAMENSLTALAETDPPTEGKTKADIIRDHEDDIKAALERGWTQKQIVDYLANDAGVSITTETLRNALSFKPSTITKKTRPSTQTKAKKATRTKKRHEAKTKATQTSTAEASDNKTVHQNGEPEPKPATEPDHGSAKAAQNGGNVDEPYETAAPTASPGHAALQDDY